jgi:ribosomal protein S18 acetylase RimI-like enzyme
MTEQIAEQIAMLINERNKLAVHYTPQKILAACGDYIYHVDAGERVLGAVEVRKTQWYQCEIDHLSVRADTPRRGIGSQLLKQAEAKAIEHGARIAQCTIRDNNNPSRGLFEKFGYKPGVTFFNRDTGSQVTVYQKALVIG